MPNYDVSVRQDWFLPLVGGAELNRIKGPSAPILFTSRPYYVELEDNATTSQGGLVDSFTVNYLEEAATSTVKLYEVTLRTQFQEYRNWALEEATTGNISIESVTLNTAFRSYGNWTTEELKTTSSAISSVSLKVTLISYTRWVTEELKTGVIGITAGTLT